MTFGFSSSFFRLKLIRYGIVGLISTGLHVGVASFFIRFIQPSLFFSNLTGFLVAYHFSYYAQSRWVFKSDLSLIKSLKYLFVQLAALLIAMLISHAAGTFNLYLKVVLTAGVLPLITFIVHRVWTFSDPVRKAEENRDRGISGPYSRIEWADILKTLLIFFVLMGHVASPYNPYIYLFHIPGFFFISGYLERFNSTSLAGFVRKKAQRLLVPFFSLNILFILLHYLVSFTTMETLFFKENMTLVLVWESLWALIKYSHTLDIGGASWFLLVLFFTAVMGKILILGTARFRVRDQLVILMSILLYLLSNALHVRQIFLPYMFDLGLHALFYYLLGYYFKKYNVFEFRLNRAYAFFLAVFALFFFSQIRWAPMNWPTRQFAFPLNFFTSMAGIYLCYLAAKRLEKNKICCKIASYIGAKTLSILMFHFIGFKLFFYLMYCLGQLPANQVGEIVLPYGSNLWLFTVFFGMGFSLLLDRGIHQSATLSLLLMGSKKPVKNKKNGACL